VEVNDCLTLAILVAPELTAISAQPHYRAPQGQGVSFPNRAIIGNGRQLVCHWGATMRAATRYSILVALFLVIGLTFTHDLQALAGESDDEASIDQKIWTIKFYKTPSEDITLSAAFVVIRNSLHYAKPHWERIRLGCLPINEIGQRLCEGLGAPIIRQIASDPGGTCGITLYLVECYR